MKQVVFYVSAAADLEVEREILGRAASEVPVDVGWRVVQSPPGNGPVDLEAIASADVHVVLMGGDIRAPVGLEWQAAHQMGRHPVALLKDRTMRTPAGQDFVKLVQQVQPWERFLDGADLRRRVLTRLADAILDDAAAYVLSPDEIATLVTWRDQLAASPQAVDDEIRGAGDSSVLLSLQRPDLRGGVALKG
ncbi:MAG: hypothetical protein MUF84_10805 [Anaerolineae bacterium]|nr:hypothetical protein [Anaerolineae bacterium]